MYLIKRRNRGEPVTIWNLNFICVVIANFMLCFGHASVNPLVASYMKYLEASAQLTGFLAGMFYGISLLLKPVSGPMATKMDKRNLLIFVFLCGAAANLGYALFHSISAFIIFRFLSGAQYSLIGALLMTLAADHLPKDKITSGIGIYGIGGAIANAVAPSTGEAILSYGTRVRDENYGFTLLFMLGAVVFVLSAIPALILDHDRKTKEDVASTGAWYKNIFTKHAAPSTFVIFLIMIPYSMLNTYIFVFGDEQGIAGISIFYITLAVTLAVFRPLSGYLTDKLGIPRIAIPAMVIFACSMVIVGSGKTLSMVVLGAVCAAIGFGASQPALQAMCLQCEPPLYRGVAGNTLYIGLDLGLFIGPYLGGLVNAKTDYSTMFKLGAAPVILAIICLIIVLPIYKKRIKELEKD